MTAESPDASPKTFTDECERNGHGQIMRAETAHPFCSLCRVIVDRKGDRWTRRIIMIDAGQPMYREEL